MATADQPSSVSHEGLQPGISQPRFQTFLNAAEGDEELARKLYVWNRDLSVAILADIAILEVALRNAMNDAATRIWGSHWYADQTVVLDERSVGQLNTAWSYLPDSIKSRANDPDVPGRVIAGCMFGFWTNLLDKGSYVGKPPRRIHADYDDLWKAAFKHAFPGARSEAKSQRDALIAGLSNASTRNSETKRLQQEVAFNRNWVHGICKIINQLRNRVAHHEPMINGFPLMGESRRLSAKEGHGYCRMLARMLDRKLAVWLDSNTTVPDLLVSRPQLPIPGPSSISSP